MNNEDDWFLPYLWCSVIAFFVGGAFFGPIGHNGGVDQERKMAASSGVGKWVLDSKSGKTVYVYGNFTQEVQP